MLFVFLCLLSSCSFPYFVFLLFRTLRNTTEHNFVVLVTTLLQNMRTNYAKRFDARSVWHQEQYRDRHLWVGTDIREESASPVWVATSAMVAYDTRHVCTWYESWTCYRYGQATAWEVSQHQNKWTIFAERCINVKLDFALSYSKFWHTFNMSKN